MRVITTLILALLFALMSTSSASAYYSTGYFTHSYNYYYPTEYLTPARTGLADKAYFYPNQYVNSLGFFRHYRAYTHNAYRTPKVAYAIPYLGERNYHYPPQPPPN